MKQAKRQSGNAFYSEGLRALNFLLSWNVINSAIPCVAKGFIAKLVMILINDTIRDAPSGQSDLKQQSAADLHGGTAHGVPTPQTPPAADTASCCRPMCVLFVLLLSHGSAFTVVMWHSWQSLWGRAQRTRRLCAKGPVVVRVCEIKASGRRLKWEFISSREKIMADKIY